MVLKRSTMVLYSGAQDIASHRVRIVLAEKGVAVEVIYVDPNNLPEDLLTLNPYNSAPTLIDRDLVLYEPNIINEYLDERFPHPPLLPVYPVARAKSRLMIYRIERDWLILISTILKGKKAEADEARKALRAQLITAAPLFNDMPFFGNEEFSLVDCYLAAILWRMPSYGIELPTASTKPIIEYAKRVFARDSFQISLSDAERELRE